MRITTACALLSLSCAALAQTEVPHIFESGQPARASEVNENFGSLEEAVNDLVEAVRQLEEDAESAGATVLDFTNVVVEIDQPGFYVLDRDWDLPGLSLVISADRVTVNLRGYEIAGGNPTVSITGNNVVVRNGRILGNGPAKILGGRALLEDLYVRGGDTGLFVGEFEYFDGDAWSAGGDAATLRDSQFICDECVAITVVAEDVEIDGNAIRGAIGGVWHESFFWPDPRYTTPQITNNDIYCGSGPCLIMEPLDGTFVIEGNRIWRGSPDYAGPLVRIDGSDGRFVNNGIWGNFYAFEIWESIGVQVNGSGNLIQGTYSKDSDLRVGIQFTANGNAYRDNCLPGYEAIIDLGGTTQTDLGGNCTNPSSPER